jgi:hypothetical protein
MDIATKETEEMGLFTKTKLNQLRDAATAAHGKWHVATQQCGRKKAWWERDGESLKDARVALAAAEAQPSDEDGNLRDCNAERVVVVKLEAVEAKRRYEYECAMAEVKALEDAKNKAVIALAEEQFNCEHLEPFSKLLLELHRRNQAMAEAQGQLPSRPQFAIQFLTQDLVDGWMREKEAQCNPPAARPIDFDGVLEFVKNYSPGGLSGKLYNAGEGAWFDPEEASLIVAGGFAIFVKPSSKTDALVKIAKQRLAAIDRTAGFLSAELGGNVDVG